MTWFEWFGRASLVLVSVAFVLALVMLVLWQVKIIVRFRRELERERQLRRYQAQPYTDSFIPPSPWN